MSMERGETQTGWRLGGKSVLAILLGFFGLVTAVNVVFIYQAVATFPGLEVASSYAAGQDFEAEVDAGRAQAERGWTVDASVRADGADARITIHFADRYGADIPGLDVRVRLIHAVDPAHDHAATLPETMAGTYQAVVANVPAGAWELLIEAYRGDERLFKSRNQLALRR